MVSKRSDVVRKGFRVRVIWLRFTVFSGVTLVVAIYSFHAHVDSQMYIVQGIPFCNEQGVLVIYIRSFRVIL